MGEPTGWRTVPRGNGKPVVALNGFGLRVPRMRSETTARIPANRLRLSGYCDTMESDIVRRQVRQIVQS